MHPLALHKKSKVAMVHPVSGRVTERDGSHLPVLFGTGSTPMLIYIALNPRRTTREIRAALGIGQRTFDVQMEDRLWPMGLVLDLRSTWTRGQKRRYIINPQLSGYQYFRNVLRALGQGCGIQSSRARFASRLPEECGGRSAVAMPRNLFWTKDRTTLLGLVAALEETYVQEACDVLPIVENSVRADVRHLVAEGVLVYRAFKHVKLYSLNSEFCAAKALRKLLRKIVSERPDLQVAARQALVRRKTVATQYTVRERAIIREIRGRIKPRGVQAHILPDAMVRLRGVS